jgi:hypothetical protein
MRPRWRLLLAAGHARKSRDVRNSALSLHRALLSAQRREQALFSRSRSRDAAYWGSND